MLQAERQFFKTYRNRGVDWHLAFWRFVWENQFQKLAWPKILKVFYCRMCLTAAFVTCFVLDLFWGPFSFDFLIQKYIFGQKRCMKKVAVKFVGYLLKTHFPHFILNFSFFMSMWLIYSQCKCRLRVFEAANVEVLFFVTSAKVQKCQFYAWGNI